MVFSSTLFGQPYISGMKTRDAIYQTHDWVELLTKMNKIYHFCEKV